MLEVPAIRLATPADARAIAELSRDAIEHGLRWRYTPERILAAMRSPTTNVAVIHARGCLLAAGIMEYGDLSAHVVLLGVQRAHRRHGLGRRLMAWLESCAVTAGLRAVDLEVREDNPNAFAFYRALGFDQAGCVRGYYDGVLDAKRMIKPLGVRRQTRPS